MTDAPDSVELELARLHELVLDGHMLSHYGPRKPTATVEPPEETYRLALESIQRWGGRYRVSPSMRLRAIRAVVDAALSDQSV